MKKFVMLIAAAFMCIAVNAQEVDSIPGQGVASMPEQTVVEEPVQAVAEEPESPMQEPVYIADPGEIHSLIAEVRNMQLDTETNLSHTYMDHVSDKYGYYTPGKEFSFTTIPLVLGGFIVKADKKNFRRARTDLEPQFHNVLDNFTQYIPLATAWGLKAFGVEGRSNWSRFVVSNVFSAAMMAGIVNGVKYSVKEMRPDGTTRNSFPSGHTATAFMAATILHKEYGLTRSPWYSVGAYSLATVTGVMRSLNNRHWISDIMVGAGIGIISTDLGYLFADLIFKKKGIVRTDAAGLMDIRKHPSFFGGSLSVTKPFGELQIGGEVMDVVYSQLPYVERMTKDNLLLPRLKMGSATTVNAEGAYFINPYVGFGGHLEVTTMPILADNLNVYQVDVIAPDGSKLPNPIDDGMSEASVDKYFSTSNSYKYRMYNGHEFMQSVDNLPMFSAQLGVFGSLPVSRRCAFGAKLLLGGRIIGSCDLDGYSNIIDEKYTEPYFDIENLDLTKEDDKQYMRVLTSTAFESIDLDIKNSMVLTTGVNFTVMLRQNMSCKMYVDYSHSRFNYDLTYLRVNMPYLTSALMEYDESSVDPEELMIVASSSHKRSLNAITGGIAVQLHF